MAWTMEAASRPVPGEISMKYRAEEEEEEEGDGHVTRIAIGEISNSLPLRAGIYS